MEHKGTKTIETKRLVLRKFLQVDAEDMFKNWVNDEEVTKFLTWEPHGNVEVTKEILEDWISEYENKNFYHWAIVLKSNINEPIGGISIVNQNQEIESVEIGYCIGKKWWGKGITTEALRAVIKYCVKELKAKRIEAKHDSININSGKVMLKANMKYEGTLRKAGKNNTGICDTSVYSILSEEY